MIARTLENVWNLRKLLTRNNEVERRRCFIQSKQGLKKGIRILVVFPAVIPEYDRTLSREVSRSPIRPQG